LQGGGKEGGSERDNQWLESKSPCIFAVTGSIDQFQLHRYAIFLPDKTHYKLR
jgi:hypothetical protein